jgi:hypothetical protein
LKLAQAKEDYLGQQISVIAPFIQRLQDLQARKFTFPEGGVITVDLGEPDADNNRFPIHLQYNGKAWSAWWNYTDRKSAQDFYQTRTYLKAEGLFQIEEEAILSPKMTAARVTHPGTKETREFDLETPRILNEIEQLATAQEMSKEAGKMLTLAQEESNKTARLLARKEIGKDGRFIAYNDGTVLDTRTNLMWAAKDNGSRIGWVEAKSYCENYRGGGYKDWRMPTQDELASLYDKSKTYKDTCGVLWNNNVHLTELIRLTCMYIWASESKAGEGRAGYLAGQFIFEDGTRFWQIASATMNPYPRALPVRRNR